jgi:hypothetical protein
MQSQTRYRNPSSPADDAEALPDAEHVGSWLF